MSQPFPDRPTHDEVEAEFFDRLHRTFPTGREDRTANYHAFVVGGRAVEYLRATGAQIVVRFFENDVRVRHMPWVLADGAAAYAASFASAFLSGLDDLQRMHGFAVESWLERDGEVIVQIIKFPNGKTARRVDRGEAFVEDR